MNYDRIYQYRFRGVSPEKKAAVWRHIARHIQGFMPDDSAILDPCAGQCEFINHVKAREAWAVDRVDSFLGSAAPHVKTVVGDIFEIPLPENHFGGIFASNFLEHLDSAAEAARFIAKMRTVLAPGGRLVLMGPNFRYCPREYFDCCDHTLILTHRAVEELLYSEDLRIVASHPRYLPYSFRSRWPAAAVLARLYLQFPWAWRVMGKQFLIVSEKAAPDP